MRCGESKPARKPTSSGPQQPDASPTMAFVALLRGINVGGKNPVSMRALQALFEQLGFSDVRTYINSGNVIFKAPKASARKLELSIEPALEEKFHAPIRVIVRSLPEMKHVVQSIPAEWSDTKTWRSNLIFLARRIDKPSIVKALHAKPEIENVFYRKGTVFWSVRWKDLTKSGVLRVNRAPIYKEMTIRNPNTARKIYELMLEKS
jgi:uncharacterized protein (DUF1697 family)